METFQAKYMAYGFQTTRTWSTLKQRWWWLTPQTSDIVWHNGAYVGRSASCYPKQETFWWTSEMIQRDETSCEVYTHLAHCASLLEYEMPGAGHCWAKSFTQNINFHLAKPAPQLFGSCRSCCAGMAHAILTGKIDPRGAWLAVHKRSRSQMKIMGLAELQLFHLQCIKTHPIVTSVENLHVYPQQKVLLETHSNQAKINLL